jgi:hypothetical protein
MTGTAAHVRVARMANWLRIGLTAVVMTIIAEIVHTVEAVLTMGYYTDPAHFPVWSKIMMPSAGPPPAAFYYYSIAFALVTWAIFGFVYEKLGVSVHEKNLIRNGIRFGALIFLVAGIPSTLTMYLLVNLPVGLLVSWTMSGLILYLIGGVLTAKLIKPV